MKKITLVGIDLAKTVFRINCANESGKRVENRNLHRDNVIRFFATLPECTVAMEACASSHYWGRRIESLGHTVKLIHPLYVKPFRLGDKNDANDAAAICAAAARPDMRFVQLKTQRQSDIQALHRARNGLIKERTATINRVRAMLAENGIIIKQGAAAAFSILPGAIDNEGNELSCAMRRLLSSQYRHLLHLNEQILDFDKDIKKLAVEEEDCKRLMQIPGLGPITATLLVAEIGNGASFRNSRALAAYMGLVPKQFSSGGKNKLFGIGKRGNAQLRTLFVHCARSVLRSMAFGKLPFGGDIEKWLYALMERNGKNKTIVALAAKLARIAWSILVRGTNFQAVAVAA